MSEILKRGRYIQLCTNGMFLNKKLDKYTPDPGLVFNVHLDGLQKSHDLAVEREGVFETAIEGIKYAKSKGFRVFTNSPSIVKPTWTRFGRCSSYWKRSAWTATRFLRPTATPRSTTRNSS